MIKILKILAIGAPVVISGGSAGVYLGVSTLNKNKSDSSNDAYISKNPVPIGAAQYSNDSLFPTLEQHDFYKYIKMKGPLAIINDDMKDQLINYILKNANIASGDIEYYVVEPNDKNDMQNIKMYFRWIDSDLHKYEKDYTFTLSKDNTPSFEK